MVGERRSVQASARGPDQVIAVAFCPFPFGLREARAGCGVLKLVLVPVTALARGRSDLLVRDFAQHPAIRKRLLEDGVRVRSIVADALDQRPSVTERER